MGERKVQTKYYPPDFDPSNLPRIRKKRENDDAVRFMLPMSVRCETCGEFMGTGLKFNARKSNSGDDYLGIRIFRFSMKCKGCPSTFIIRTDPKNSDYSCESGVRRNYEPWKDAKKVEQEGNDERNRQDQDSIQALENKTMDAKEQMEELDALDDIKAANAKRARVNVDQVLAIYEFEGAGISNSRGLSAVDEARIDREAAMAVGMQQTNVTISENENEVLELSKDASKNGVRIKDSDQRIRGTTLTKKSSIEGMMTLRVKSKIAKKKSSISSVVLKKEINPTSNSLVAYDDSSSGTDDD